MLLHELQEAAARSPACLLCELEQQQAEGYLEGIIADGVNDPKLRAELRARGGYCAPHLTRFLTLAHPLAAAIVLQDLLELRLARVSQGKAMGRLRCPACEVETRARKSLVASLKKRRDDAAVEAALRRASLCVLHLELAAQAVPALRESLARRHDALLAALAELVRKHDYRFAHEAISDAEKASLAETARLFGAKSS